MSEKLNESGINKEEVIQLADSLAGVLSETTPALENLDWSADRKTMSLSVTLADKSDDDSSTYAFLENLSNFTADELANALAYELIKVSDQQEQPEDVEDAEYREVEEANQDEQEGGNTTD